VVILGVREVGAASLETVELAADRLRGHLLDGVAKPDQVLGEHLVRDSVVQVESNEQVVPVALKSLATAENRHYQDLAEQSDSTVSVLGLVEHAIHSCVQGGRLAVLLSQRPVLEDLVLDELFDEGDVAEGLRGVQVEQV